MRRKLALLMVGMLTAPAMAGLVDSRTAGGAAAVKDGVISPNEYNAGNSNKYLGGGAGFGGTLGGGAMYMNSVGGNLYLGFQPGNALNDNVVIHLDTRAGGQVDATMNDTGDPGRNLSSNLTRDTDDVFPIGILPDYSIVIGGFGIVTFELTAGNTPNHLNFVDFDGTFTGNNPALAREYSLPLASIGNPSVVNFFVSYGSDTNFMSNESIPAEGFNLGSNPGFGTPTEPVLHDNYDQLVIPEPASIGLLGLVSLAAFRRQR